MRHLLALLCASALLCSCVVVDSRAIRTGPAYSTALESKPPDASAVFIKGQYPPGDLPAAKLIATVVRVVAPPPSPERRLAMAEQEAEALHADYVVVEELGQTRGASLRSDTLAFHAYRVLPVRLGFQLNPDQLVEWVQDPAKSAGLQLGDHVLAVDGTAWSSHGGVQANRSPGDVIPIDVLRNGTSVRIEVTASANPHRHLELPSAAHVLLHNQ